MDWHVNGTVYDVSAYAPSGGHALAGVVVVAGAAFIVVIYVATKYRSAQLIMRHAFRSRYVPVNTKTDPRWIHA